MGAAGIIGGLGLVQSFLGQQDANRQRGQAMDLERERLQMDRERSDRLKGRFDEVQKLVDAFRAKGGYDPNKWAENYAQDFQKGAHAIQNQNLVNLNDMGYKPTDSEWKYKTDRLDRTLAHDLAVGEGRAREGAVSAEVNAINSANANYLQTPDSSRLSAMYQQGAQNSTPDWGATIGGILPLIKGWGGKSPAGSTGVNPVNQGQGIGYDGSFHL